MANPQMQEDAILVMDRQRADNAALANATLIDALWNAHPERMAAAGAPRSLPVRRPTRYDYQEWKPGHLSRSARSILDQRAAAAHAKERARWGAQKVSRDPCPKCGVRGDLHGERCR